MQIESLEAALEQERKQAKAQNSRQRLTIAEDCQPSTESWGNSQGSSPLNIRSTFENLLPLVLHYMLSAMQKGCLLSKARLDRPHQLLEPPTRYGVRIAHFACEASMDNTSNANATIWREKGRMNHMDPASELEISYNVGCLLTNAA